MKDCTIEDMDSTSSFSEACSADGEPILRSTRVGVWLLDSPAVKTKVAHLWMASKS